MENAIKREPQVGDVWLYAGEELTLYAKEPSRDGFATCRAGTVDPRDGFVHKAEDCCWMYTSTLRDCKFLRGLPAPPPRKEKVEPVPGRFPPQAGDVWRTRDGLERTFTGRNWGGQRDKWETTEDTYCRDGYFTDGFLTFIRHASPATPVEVVPRSGETWATSLTPLGYVLRELRNGVWSAVDVASGPVVIPGAVHDSTLRRNGKRIAPAHREDVKPTVSEADLLRSELDALKPKPRARPTYATVDNLLYLTAERGDAYCRLMAKLLADEGVTVDSRLRAAVFESDAVDANPEPYMGRTDEDNLPGVHEFGTRTP